MTDQEFKSKFSLALKGKLLTKEQRIKMIIVYKNLKKKLMKKNTCYGWKILTKENRQSISNWDHRNKWSVEYPINKEVKPKLKRSKLFFFRNKDLAFEFLNFWETRKNSNIVVKCIATNPIKNELVAIDKIDYQEFWKCFGQEFNVQCVRSPLGTWLADSIKCLE